jgi:hypothetical protein
MGGVAGPTFVHAEALAMRGQERGEVDILGGYRGILYRRRMFDWSIVEELNELLNEAPFVVDDQLFGMNLRRRGIGRFVIQTMYPNLNNTLNFKFLNLGHGIYDEGNSKLAEDSLRRLEALYARKGWKL